jgi:hypothetical protein
MLKNSIFGEVGIIFFVLTHFNNFDTEGTVFFPISSPTAADELLDKVPEQFRNNFPVSRKTASQKFRVFQQNMPKTALFDFG